MSSQTSKKAKSAAQQYKKAASDNAAAAHDSLAAATAKGVEEAHVHVTSGSKYPPVTGKPGQATGKGLPKHLPDKIVALVFEILGAASGLLAGGVFAVCELFGYGTAHLRKASAQAKKAA